MKLAIVHPDANNTFDPPLVSTVRQAPGITENKDEADVVVVPITRHPEFVFKESLGDEIAGRPWVLVDAAEFGWDYNQTSSLLWGKDRTTHPWFQEERWEKFDQFVWHNPPIITFQRELLAKDRSDSVQPFEYLNWLPDTGMEKKEDFEKRPLEILMNWGRSHESRMFMHGALFMGASKHGMDVITRWEDVDKAISDKPDGKYIASIFAPHYSRIDVHEVDKWNHKTKINISLSGCGRKCFRHGEGLNGSIMALPEDDLAWTYPLEHLVNCIRLPVIDLAENANISGRSAVLAVEELMWCVERDLYDLYVRSQETGNAYRPENYLRRHFVGEIERRMP